MLTLTASEKETLRGGEVIARMLKQEGVSHVFGIIDGTYFGFYSSLPKVGIRLITPRHETAAAHMAGAFARQTGGLGVCMASNGPGVANILPGVAVESAEANRVLLITSARRTGTINPDRGGTFQSFPQTEVTAPMTKWSCRVPSAERLPELVRRALRISFSGRPGVVHLDIPEDILNTKHTFQKGALWKPEQYRTTSTMTPTAAEIERAADLLLQAERPMIHAGSGVVHAQAFAELDRLARLLHAPITTSWGARSAVLEDSGYAVPLIYMGLTNRVRNEADAVLALGSRLGETDWWGKAPYWAKPGKQKWIQVDVDAEALGVNRPLDLGVQACTRVFLEKLFDAVMARKEEIDVATRRSWLLGIQDERAKHRAKLDKRLKDKSTPVHSAQIPHICQKVLPKDSTMVLDGGNTVIWANFFHEVRSPNSLLGTVKMGMLGAGLPQAIGAKAAHPDRVVYCVTGDGAMGMQCQELETAVRNDLPVICIVLCDKQWGMVKINQQFQLKPIKTLIKKKLGPDETINADFCDIAFDKLAESMGAHGERVDSAEGFEAALKRAVASGKPSVIHVDVDPTKHMWAPALKEFKDMHQEPKG